VAGFMIARDPVSAGDHLAFIADGGYSRRELWTDEGWAWREAEGAEAPLYWERDGEGGWLERRFDEVAPVDPSLPLCHVSAHEADAHARWAGARLPTEIERECAAQGAPAGEGGANVDQLGFRPAPVGAYPEAPSGCRGMLGDVWEWTASAFEAYPGFRAFPYPEYAEVFFGPRYRVLRGGSWATQAVAARPSFRNWDLPERRQIFSGLRLARDLA
jgi:iron(II)-dependent oxidoreductase